MGSEPETSKYPPGLAAWNASSKDVIPITNCEHQFTRMDEVEFGSAEEPCFFNVEDFEGAIDRDVVWLYWCDVDAENLRAGILVCCFNGPYP